MRPVNALRRILVPADYGKPISRVDVTNAAGFDLQAGEPPPGWSLTRSGDTLRFSGGPIAPYGYAVFAIRGVAPTKGELLFRVTTTSPDGSVMVYDGPPGSRNQGAIVYAGIAPHLPSNEKFPWVSVAGGVVAGIGAFGTGVILLRRRRSRRPDVLEPMTTE